MFPQITLHPQRNARQLDLNNLRRHQLRNHNILLPLSRKRDHRCRTRLRADAEDIRGREVIYPLEVKIPMDDRQADKDTQKASPPVASHLQVKLTAQNSLKHLSCLQNPRVGDQGVHIQFLHF